MSIAWIDVVILALITLSAILSLFRGFVKEALALASWVVALWVAMAFYEDLAAWLAHLFARSRLNTLTFSVDVGI